jgi:hypothetical protein
LPQRRFAHIHFTSHEEKYMASKARAELKAAAQKVSALEKQLTSLESAAERANAASADAAGELDTYSELEKEITRWRVSQVKKGASTKTLPDSLRAKAEAKRTAADELEQSRETLEAINRELEETRAQLGAATDNCYLAAGAVISELADVLGNELAGLNGRRAEILHALFGIQRLQMLIAGKPQTVALSDACQRAMNGTDVLIFPPTSDPISALADRWIKRYKALLVDPDVEITVPKPVMPSDYVFAVPATFEEGQGWVGGTPGSWKPEAD